MQIIKKQDINLLIDTLIKAGGGQTIYGKLSDILKLITDSEDIMVLRTTLLLWLDNMNIFDVDFQSQPPIYNINKPVWIPGAIEGQYNLIGALTLDEIENLENTPNVLSRSNSVSFQQFKIELPNTFYTNDINALPKTKFTTIQNSLFCDLNSDDDVNAITRKLKAGELEINEEDGFEKISFVKNEQHTTVYIEKQDDVKMFDWISRNYYKCDLKEEIKPEKSDVKLIRIEKKFLYNTERYTLLLKRNMDSNWEYLYFDPAKVDERWGRFIFISKLSYYDLHSDISSGDLPGIFNNLVDKTQTDTIVLAGDWMTKNNINNIIKISNPILKQFILYDKRKGILAVPVTLPLPKKFMKYLYSCSGSVPQIFKNRFSRNPSYKLKLLFSGKLSTNGVEIPYKEESYFRDEDMYLFTCVPKELADTIVAKLGLSYYKRTFFENIQ